MLTHVHEVAFTSTQLAKIEELKQIQVAQDERELFRKQAVNCEHEKNTCFGSLDTSVEGMEHPEGGALWDIFRRQDTPKLEEYLRKYYKEFRHVDCLPVDQVNLVL